jgi:hypothetical protein
MSFQHRFVQGLGATKRMHPSPWLGRILLAITLLVLGTQVAQAQNDAEQNVRCTGGTCTCARNTDGSNTFLPRNLASPWENYATAPDLVVTGECIVPLSKITYYFKRVNILNGGTLLFYEGFDRGQTLFWASSIIVENGGRLMAYGTDAGGGGFGGGGSLLTIVLYGKNEAEGKPDQQNQGALCKTPLCGIPVETWNNNGKDIIPGLPGGVRDFFYQYGPLHGDGKCTVDGSVYDKARGACTSGGEVGYFGNKVLAVSYGGTSQLAGHKGVSFKQGLDGDSTNSGISWMRLADGQSLRAGNANAPSTSLVLERDPNDTASCTQPNPQPCWGPGDEIVVTTTDYLPGHSEKLRIRTIARTDPGNPGGDPRASVTFDALDDREQIIKTGVRWGHNGVRYGGPNDPKQWSTRLKPWTKNSLDPDLVKNGAETRAAVALLSRSIRIVSGGDVAGAPFGYHTVDDYEKGKIDPHYSYGGHMVIRQGFAAVQIQGVEFAQMGQGGRLGHYPVHFHQARQTPPNTYVKDSSINESMTRWIVLHSTLGVTVQRNVGYKSIGHGFYLEDGTETDNKFYSNIGIFARAAVENEQNPRKVPGILADNFIAATFPFDSDYRSPSVFWITNGWNDFSGNMAAGAGTCGACYWFVAAKNGDQPDFPIPENTDLTADGRRHQKWGETINRRYTYGYAGLQRDQEGATPLRSFFKNYCTSAMHSFLDINAASKCQDIGVDAANAPISPDPRNAANRLRAIRNPLAPLPPAPHYYPNAYAGGLRKARHGHPLFESGADRPGARPDAPDDPPLRAERRQAAPGRGGMVHTAVDRREGAADLVRPALRRADGGARAAHAAHRAPLRSARVAVEREPGRAVQTDESDAHMRRLRIFPGRGLASPRAAPAALTGAVDFARSEPLTQGDARALRGVPASRPRATIS